MLRKLIGAMVGILLQLSIAQAQTCDTLDACLARFPSVATNGPGIGPEENALAKAVQRFGTPAIPPLIKLLESNQENVRTLAGYTLRDIDGLKPEHLAPLIRARQNGDGWIPPAIASIGTPEAVEFLVNDLRNHPEVNTQVTWALKTLGEKSAPGIARLLKCTDPCDEQVLHAAVFVLSELKEKAAATLPLLMQTASNDKLPQSSRKASIAAIGAIGKSSEPYVSQLALLKKRAPALTSSVDAALASIGVPEAVPALLQALTVDPGPALKRIADLGRSGYAAGSTVEKYLGDQSLDTRVAAANALGRIGYAPATGALQKALEDKDDWKLVYASVLALSQLKSDISMDALKRVRGTHWFPPVRDLAASALEHFKTGIALTESQGWQLNAVVGSPNTCSRTREKLVKEPESRKLYSKDHLYELARLAYESAKRTHGSALEPKPGAEQFDKRREIPDVALKVSDGWLTGTDHGEWGGEMIHMPARAAREVLFEANIQDIFFLEDQLVATSGLAHLGFNGGMLLKIDTNAGGRYTVKPWKRLPAAPVTSSLIEGGGLLVNTQDGGTIIIDSAGNLRMAECLSD